MIGNHSNTMFLDIQNAKHEGKNLEDIFSQEELSQIQKNIRTRGGEILQLQKHSASYSAAVSIIKHLDFIYHEADQVYSLGIHIDEILGHTDIFVSVPVHKKNGKIVMVENFWRSYGDEKIK